MRVWKALDKKTRMSPFVASKNPKLAVAFPVGERVSPVHGRVYACTTEDACRRWGDFATRKFCKGEVIVVPAEADDVIPNPPMMSLVRFTELDPEMVRLAWEISDDIRNILGGRMEVKDEEANRIAGMVSRPGFPVRPHWVRMGKNQTHVACRALTCFE